MPRKSVSKRPAKSDGESAPIRLQRVLAGAGFGSRRQCEELIEDGRVHVDGVVADKLGTTVDPETQKILVDGQLLKKQKLVYYAVNKPVGVVTTNRDPQGRPRVVDLVPPDERVFPVGRLDLSSEGLILLTNDGELAQRLSHPSFGVRKVYRVTVAGKVDNETMKKMREGIYIAEGFVQVDGAKLLKVRARATELEITLREGKNREIRRILARLGHKVQQLRRIAVGPLRLGEVPAGAYRVLRREEVDKLRSAVDAAEKAADAAPSKPSYGSKSPGSKSPGGKSRPTQNRSTKKFATRSAGGPPKKVGARKSSPPTAKGKKDARNDAAKTSTTYKLPTKSAGGGAIIGGDAAPPAFDRSAQKDHVVKPRPKGGKGKAKPLQDAKPEAKISKGKTARGGGKTTRGFKGKADGGRSSQRRTKKR